MSLNMSEYHNASADPLQPQLYMKEPYFQAPKAVPSPDAALKTVISPTARSIFATPHSEDDSKHEPATEHKMGNNRAITHAIGTIEENNTTRKRLSTFLHSTWRAFRKCICSPPLSELDDVNSSTAQLLYADRYQPKYGYGSIAAGAKPTIISDNALSRPDTDCPSPERSMIPRAARPTPKENFVV